MKKTAIASLLALTALFVHYQGLSKPPITLTSDVIGLIDGISIGIDAQTLGLIVKIRKQITTIKDGEKTANGELKGLYLFQGAHHSIHSLAELESTVSSGPLYDELQKCLKVAKDDFIAKTSPFLENARGSKTHMVTLITESCEKHDRADSKLLQWGETEEGSEDTVLYEEVPTFKEFELFITDLLDFLADLVHSCPKAKKQLYALVKNQTK